MDGRPILKHPVRWRAEKLTDKYIMLMLLVFPLFWGFEGYSAITVSKHIFFVSATCLWLIGLIACAAFGISRRGFRFKSPGPARWPVLAFALACALSALLSPYAGESLLGAGRYDGLLTILLYCAVFLGVSLTAKPEVKYSYCLGISVFFCCIVAALQLSGLDPFGLYPNGYTYYDAHIKYSSEFLGTIGNSGLLAGYLSLSLPILAAVYVTRGAKADALLLIPAAFSSFVLAESKIAGAAVALVLCALVSAPVLLRDMGRVSRAFAALAASLLGVLAALAVNMGKNGGAAATILVFSKLQASALSALILCLIISAWSRRTKMEFSPRDLCVFFAALSVAAALAGLAAIYFWPGDSGTVFEISRVLHGEISDSFGSSRILIWKNALELFPERPLLGGGPGTLALRLDVTFSRFVPETGKTMTTFVDNAHNEYIGYLVNTGLLGLVSYLAAVFLGFYGWMKAAGKDALITSFGCGVIAYWIYGLFGLGLSLVAPMFWICWGLIAARRGDNDCLED